MLLTESESKATFLTRTIPKPMFRSDNKLFLNPGKYMEYINFGKRYVAWSVHDNSFGLLE